ncbi:MAG: hypothetical protein LBU80_04945 [Rikenellaceae bacterium]|jgi:hypothetical protein|nr:hypothetical protein [Rikenellaceae bacterium]
MDEARAIIERLRTKVAEKVAERNHAVADREKSDAARKKLTREKEALEARVLELQERVRVLELTRGMVGVSGDAEAARKRVNRLIREVDKCIALMNTE